MSESLLPSAFSIKPSPLIGGRCLCFKQRRMRVIHLFLNLLIISIIAERYCTFPLPDVKHRGG